MDQPGGDEREDGAGVASRSSAGAWSGSRWPRRYAGFGTEVTLIARSGLLGAMEPFAGELVRKSLEALGATVLTGVDVTGAQPRADDEAPR